MHTDTIKLILDRIRTSLWFIPGLLSIAALVLALITTTADRLVPDEWLTHVPLVFSGRPAGARAVLSTIATSMIGIAGVVFSMTIVSLQLASSQFGPRLLRNFMRDRANQFVLGAFIAIFLYCILILPSVDTSAESAFVPHIAVTLAVAGAVLGLALLVYFIDHVAQSIHADAVIRSVGDELDASLDRIFPEGIGDEGAALDEASDDWLSIKATRPGFVRVINGDVLLEIAQEHDLVIRIDARPGTFVTPPGTVASIRAQSDITDEVKTRILGTFTIGTHRTTLQDCGFAFEQLTEMAVRALSAGINDPTTATHCVHRLGAGLTRFVERPTPASCRSDTNGQTRLIAEPVSFEHILDLALEPIARNAASQLCVWLRLLEVQRLTSQRVRRSEDREIVVAQAQRFVADAMAIFPQAHDRDRIREASAWAMS